MIALETERLLLREFRDADWDDYARICADAEVMKFISPKRPLTRDEAWRSMAFFAGHWQLRGYGMWAVEEKAAGHIIGRVGLYNPAGWPGLELGWPIDRTRWGQGFATEAGRAALDYALTTLGADHVISIIHPDNHASIRVAEKLGETLETRTKLKQLDNQEVLIYGVRNRAE